MGRVSDLIFRPDFLTRDVLVVNEILELDGEQYDIIEMLLEDYDETFRMAVEETRAVMADLGDSSGVADLEAERVDDLRSRMDEMRSEMRAAREAARSEASEDESEAANEDERRVREEARAARREAIRSEFGERMSEIRNAFREIRRAQLQSPAMQDLLDAQLELLKRFARARSSMSSEVVDAAQSVLTEAQLVHWPTLERRLRRLRELPRGSLQGERTDLWPIVEATLPAVDETHHQAVLDVMSSWELDLDDALRRRVDFDQTAMIASIEAMQTSDFEALLKIAEQRKVRNETARDVTDLAIDSITLQLEGELGADFRKRALAAGYDRIYRSNRAVRVIKAALELEGLDEETLTAIAVLLEDCTVACGELNEEILNIVRTHEEPREMRFVRRMLERETGVETSREDQDPIGAAFEKRGALEQEYLDRLKELLGETQFNALPGAVRRDRRGDRGGWGRGGPGGEDREARRAEFMQRFDENGDGEIDEAERDKIRNFFREMRYEGGFGAHGGGPPRGGGDRPGPNG
jgi:hypothetical protein